MERNNAKGIEECLNRVLGRCKKCIRDCDINHHPNNYDCPNYKPIKLQIYEVKDKGYKDIKN